MNFVTKAHVEYTDHNTARLVVQVFDDERMVHSFVYMSGAKDDVENYFNGVVDYESTEARILGKSK